MPWPRGLSALALRLRCPGTIASDLLLEKECPPKKANYCCELFVAIGVIVMFFNEVARKLLFLRDLARANLRSKIASDCEWNRLVQSTPGVRRSRS